MIDINPEEYNYLLPPDKIAQYPLEIRDQSRLLVYRNGSISDSVFNRIHTHIPPGSLLVFNNTRVVRARLFFRKDSGAIIEVFCLEPASPPDYALSFSSSCDVEWKCLVGNSRKWKSGTISTVSTRNGKNFSLFARKLSASGDAWRIRFSWDAPDLTFGEVIDSAGEIPLPPYINRPVMEKDIERYQTIYSLVKGSVAAPTAGLHFTGDVLREIQNHGSSITELTLHVGAGTFQPVKSANIYDHEMHTEHFFISETAIEKILNNYGKVIAVGTTSVRAMETLYWIGLKISKNPEAVESPIFLDQWEPYNLKDDLPPAEALEEILGWMKVHKILSLEVGTRIIIIPGYRYKLTDGIITNFHLPKSTLLLLVSAWVGEDWRKIYDHATENDYRFLSYGDSSLLYR